MASSEASYKVTYFNGRGNGEIIRLALVVAGKEFEDERLTGEQWNQRKAGTPTKQMPFLTVKENGKERVYGQSKACARYLAKKFGLFGKTIDDEVLIDEALECIGDTFQEFVKYFFEKDEAKKTEAKNKLADVTIPKLNDYITFRNSKFENCEFITGSKMSIADLHLYNIVVMFDDEQFVNAWKKCQVSWKITELIKADKNIAAWRVKHSTPTKI